MPQHTRRRVRYPHHWLVRVPRLPAIRQQPEPGAAAAEARSAAAQFPDVQDAFDGELVTAPWMGLHYRTEAP